MLIKYCEVMLKSAFIHHLNLKKSIFRDFCTKLLFYNVCYFSVFGLIYWFLVLDVTSSGSNDFLQSVCNVINDILDV